MSAVVELRHEPVQKRGIAKVERIEQAARAALMLHGRDRFTTQHVAELAGVSIGTLYRYFPDRVSILDRVWPDRESGNPVEAGVRW